MLGGNISVSDFVKLDHFKQEWRMNDSPNFTHRRLLELIIHRIAGWFGLGGKLKSTSGSKPIP